jgi:uncharacterized membrane protein
MMNDPLLELEQLTEEEIRGYEIYRRKFMALYPPPEKPRPVKQGWEFYAYFLVSVAAVLLASMRTAEQFYRAATFSANPILGYVEAFLAVFTVETGIVVYAAVLAVRRKSIAHWVMWVGIILLAAISIVAGLGQSLYLTSDIDPSILKYTEYMLSILIGPGASIAALIGGHILGQQIANAAQQYERATNEYDTELQQYNERIIRTWQRSIERRIVLGVTPYPSKVGLPEIESEMTPEVIIEATNGTQKVEKIVETKVNQPSQVIASGGNHRQLQQAPLPKPSPSKLQAQPIAVQAPVQIDPKLTRSVTQWLVLNGKTPFDNDLNITNIAKDTNVQTETVRSILLKMRNSKPV